MKSGTWIGVCLGAFLALSGAAQSEERTRIDLGVGDLDARAIADRLDRIITVQPASPSATGVAAPVSLMLRVEFAFSSAELTPRARRALDRVVSALNDPRLQLRRFLIEGHTDVVGSDEINMSLSQQRALSVADYLQHCGVNADRLAVQGYGKTQLLAGIPPTDGRNRRVEIVPLL
jgi:outer membrane protein OmpA-like peptidoglycan-associated protein